MKESVKIFILLGLLVVGQNLNATDKTGNYFFGARIGLNNSYQRTVGYELGLKLERKLFKNCFLEFNQNYGRLYIKPESYTNTHYYNDYMGISIDNTKITIRNFMSLNSNLLFKIFHHRIALGAGITYSRLLSSHGDWEQNTGSKSMSSNHPLEYGWNFGFPDVKRNLWGVILNFDYKITQKGMLSISYVHNLVDAFDNTTYPNDMGKTHRIQLTYSHQIVKL